LRSVSFGFFTSGIGLIFSKDVFRLLAELVLVDATDAWSVAGRLTGVCSSWKFQLLFLLQLDRFRPQHDRTRRTRGLEFSVDRTGKLRKLKILHYHYQLLQPDSMLSLIIYQTGVVLYFDLGFCVSSFSELATRMF
jgi:hypothetical protein